MEAWSQPAPDLTFASLLDVEEIRLGEPELVSGGDQVGRVVRWVHIADSENVAQFLEGGELVLSTGMSYRSSLSRRQPSSISSNQPRPPARSSNSSMTTAGPMRPRSRTCEGQLRVELPIVVLRRRIKFVRVTELAHQELLKRQLARVEHARTVHEVFTQLSLESAGAQDIVNRTAELLGTLCC